MHTSIFNYGNLPEFKNFTPENIRKQFPVVLEKISDDFKNIPKSYWSYTTPEWRSLELLQ